MLSVTEQVMVEVYRDGSAVVFELLYQMEHPGHISWRFWDTC